MTLNPSDIQRTASDPRVSAWVSASAGTGKTKVLSDRVLRLLLDGNEPEKILCLTYTKSASAEMSNRLFEILSRWVSAPKQDLIRELHELNGQMPDEKTLIRARQLFALVLEAKGGMKIMTFHSFCQSLLKRFPIEAGVSPYFEAADDTLAAELLNKAALQAFNNPVLRGAFETMADYLDDKSLKKLLDNMIKDASLLRESFENFPDEKKFAERLRLLLDLDAKAPPAVLIKRILPPEFLPLKENKDGQDENSADGIPTSKEAAEKKETEQLKRAFDAFKFQYINKTDEEIPKRCKEEKRAFAEQVYETNIQLKAWKVYDLTLAMVKVARDILESYKRQKEQRGVLDYDDLILSAKALLEKSDMASWVLYKLDGGIDHILVDEAQDTSPDQWAIVRPITEEFFSGQGRSEKIRTLFVVGDRKQSIYSFQKADPGKFEQMRHFFGEKIKSALGKDAFREVPLNISFRSTQSVLDLVNMVLQNGLSRQGILLENEEAFHIPHRDKAAGRVEIYPLIKDEKKEEDSPWFIPSKKQKEIPSALKQTAQDIADKIEQMIKGKELLPSRGTPIEAKDIMILVRKRTGDFINTLVRLLKEKGIPVAGVDRLALKEHTAVIDLLSLGNFLLLPEDDLTLAALLKSPLFNVTEEELYDLCSKRGQNSLYRQIQLQNRPLYERLKQIADLTDTVTPFSLFSYVLGPLGGKASFLKRLGQDAAEALDEFLNLALDYEQNNTPSLQTFLQWIQNNDIVIKRDLDQGDLNAVRIMTVHGSKGLQGNIVFLPDTRGRLANMDDCLFWEKGVPLYVPNKETMLPETVRMKEKMQKAAQEEYRRLLYVALTRAKDRLYIYGYDKQKKAADYNWYDMITSSLSGYDAAKPYILFNEQREMPPLKPAEEKQEAKVREPAWLSRPPVSEPAPSKPLSPSKLAEEEPPSPSPVEEKRALALLRGTYLHLLLQKLPQLSPEKWEKTARVLRPEELPEETALSGAEKVFRLLQDERFKEMFGPNSLAEAPLIGTIGTQVFSGQVDRLVVKEDEILLIDYKTNQHPPKNKNEISPLYKTQVIAYKEILKNIFPDKKIRPFLLWTETLDLMEL